MGTRERYAAEIVPYFDSTDHLVFNDAIIGVPGVTLTNWPDDFIHSSDDDLWQMDPTQLQRNAFIVAATALYFANLEPAGARTLLSQIYGSTQRRLSESFARATEILLSAKPGEGEEAHADAANLIRQTAEYLTRTLDSVGVLGLDETSRLYLDKFKKDVHERADQLVSSLWSQAELIAGGAIGSPPLPSPTIGQAMKELQGKVPVVVGSIREFLDKRRDIGDFGLHGLMAYEVWNFVDGKRSYLDIYKAVRAEAQSAGAWYYGSVSAKQVADLLDAGVKAGLLKLP